MAYRVIPGTADRQRRLRRERERRELEQWTRNRAGEYSGTLRSRDPEVRRRWCKFFGITKYFKDIKPRPRYPSYRGELQITELDDESDDSENSTGSSDFAIMEDDDWATKKGPGRSMVPSEDYIVTAHQFSCAFHLDGTPDSDAIFWSRQTEGYAQLWQSAGLLLENPEFIEVTNYIESKLAPIYLLCLFVNVKSEQLFRKKTNYSYTVPA